MTLKPFLIGVSVALFVSCSVFEQRGDCPCLLEIVTTKPTSGRVLDVAGFDNESRLLFDRFEREVCPARYEREVKRCAMSIAGVLSEIEPEYSPDGRTISVAKGMQADSLFVGVTRVDASGETASSTVRLHKQFTTIHIFEEQYREDCNLYKVKVLGACAGLDVLTLSPVSGDFEYVTNFGQEGASFKILRMSPSAPLWISLVEISSGEVFRTFPVGQLMLDAGYDCQAQDLQDVEIGVNLINFTCSIAVNDWKGDIIVVDI